MKIKNMGLAITAIASFLLVSCHGGDEKIQLKNKEDKLDIVTSITPLASIVNYIGGEEVNTTSLVKAGSSPHFYDTKASDIISINNADLVFTVGLGIDTFTEKLTKDKEKVVFADFAEKLTGEEHHHDDEDEDEHHHHEDEEESHGHDVEHEHKDDSVFYDPHLWLGKENAKSFAGVVKAKLIGLKESKKEVFETNYNTFVNELDTIYSEFESKIKYKKEQNFVIFHNAYGYLFHDLKIHEEDFIILQESVGSEPSALELKEIIDTLKEKNIKVIYKEPQMDSKLVKTLSQDYDLTISELNPIGSDVTSSDYFDNLRSNLDNLMLRYE